MGGHGRMVQGWLQGSLCPDDLAKWLEIYKVLSWTRITGTSMCLHLAQHGE